MLALLVAQQGAFVLKSIEVVFLLVPQQPQAVEYPAILRSTKSILTLQFNMVAVLEAVNTSFKLAYHLYWDQFVGNVWHASGPRS